MCNCLCADSICWLNYSKDREGGGGGGGFYALEKFVSISFMYSERLKVEIVPVSCCVLIVPTLSTKQPKYLDICKCVWRNEGKNHHCFILSLPLCSQTCLKICGLFLHVLCLVRQNGDAHLANCNSWANSRSWSRKFFLESFSAKQVEHHVHSIHYIYCIKSKECAGKPIIYKDHSGVNKNYISNESTMGKG